MPVKIYPSPVNTNNLNGVINETDLQEMINNYQTDVRVDSKVKYPSAGYLRFFSAFIRKDELSALMTDAPEDGGINLHFALTNPGQKGCDGVTDIGNMLTFVLCAAKSDETDIRSIDNFVLIPGFKSYSPSLDSIVNLEEFNAVPPVDKGKCCISPGGGTR